MLRVLPALLTSIVIALQAQSNPNPNTTPAQTPAGSPSSKIGLFGVSLRNSSARRIAFRLTKTHLSSVGVLSSPLFFYPGCPRFSQ
jgi:hypothetical protein